MNDPLYLKYLVSTMYGDVMVSQHCSNWQQQIQETTTDITLQLSDGDIRLHKLLLVTVSPYFKTMLSAPFQEQCTGIVCLPRVDTATMLPLVEYIYTGRADITPDNVIDLLMLADYFQIHALVSACGAMAKRHLCASTCLQLHAVARACNLRDLANSAIWFAVLRYREILEQPEQLVDIPFETMYSFLKHIFLYIPRDLRHLKLTAVYKWTHSDPTARLSQMLWLLSSPELLTLLHQRPHIAPLITSPASVPSVIDTRMANRTLNTCLEAHMIGSKESFCGEEELTSPDCFDQMRLQQNLESAQVVLLLAGEHCGRRIKTVECLQEGRNKWSYIMILPDRECSLTQRNIEHEKAVLRECMPVVYSPDYNNKTCAPESVSVTENLTDLNSLSDFSEENFVQVHGSTIDEDLSYPIKDPKLNTILNTAYKRRCKLVNNLPERDPSCYRVPVNSVKEHIIQECSPTIYSALTSFVSTNTFAVLGGRSGLAPVADVSEYCVHTNEWTLRSPLPEGVFGGGAAVIEGILYYVAGAKKTGYSDQLWRLCPDQPEWEQLSSLPAARYHVAVAAINGSLYVTGGLNDTGACLGTGYRYCPHTGAWTAIGDMSQQRAYHSACVCGDHLYVMGGYDGKYWLDSTERYDPFTDSWTQVCSMMSPRSSFGCVSVANDSYILVMGGFTGSRATNRCESYSLATDSWQPRPSLRTDRIGPIAATVTVARWRQSEEHCEHIDIT